MRSSPHLCILRRRRTLMLSKKKSQAHMCRACDNGLCGQHWNSLSSFTRLYPALTHSIPLPGFIIELDRAGCLPWLLGAVYPSIRSFHWRLEESFPCKNHGWNTPTPPTTHHTITSALRGRIRIESLLHPYRQLGHRCLIHIDKNPAPLICPDTRIKLTL